MRAPCEALSSLSPTTAPAHTHRIVQQLMIDLVHHRLNHRRQLHHLSCLPGGLPSPCVLRSPMLWTVGSYEFS